MKMIVMLPPPPRGLDVNHGLGARWWKTRDVKQAHASAGVRAREAMHRAGIARGEYHPRYVHIVTFWRGAHKDYDNALASCKAYQDAIFDKLGANDREIICGASTLCHTETDAERGMVRYALFDDRSEFQFDVDEMLDRGEGEE